LSAGAVTIGATTTGSASADSGAGFGSGGFSMGSIGFGGSRLGSGLLTFLGPSRRAFGGGAFWRRPPPPPPPPGPGASRSTRRIGSAGGSTFVSVVAIGSGPKGDTNTSAAQMAPGNGRPNPKGERRCAPGGG